MPRKKERQKTAHNTIKSEAIAIILGLFFGYMEYLLDLRPNLVAVGPYWLGFVDCVVIVLSVLLLRAVLSNSFEYGGNPRSVTELGVHTYVCPLSYSHSENRYLPSSLEDFSIIEFCYIFESCLD
ncbi:MAG: hypothetical protein ACFFB3_23040 [Candidatus Hodarchaeota archaeon]